MGQLIEMYFGPPGSPGRIARCCRMIKASVARKRQIMEDLKATLARKRALEEQDRAEDEELQRRARRTPKG